MNRKLIFAILIFFFAVNAKAEDQLSEAEVNDLVQVNSVFESTENVDLEKVQDLIDRNQKIEFCSMKYIDERKHRYTKAVQENLYDLVHNFKKVVTELKGKEGTDKVSYDEMLDTNAHAHCEQLYDMGWLDQNWHPYSETYKN
jgi:hypothetical protein